MKYLPQSTATMGGYMLVKNGNISDVLLTGGLYFINRMFGFSKLASALTSFGLICAGEVAQKLNLIPGTYDRNDFIAAGLGAGLAFAIDAISSRINQNDLTDIVD